MAFLIKNEQIERRQLLVPKSIIHTQHFYRDKSGEIENKYEYERYNFVITDDTYETYGDGPGFGYSPSRYRCEDVSSVAFYKGSRINEDKHVVIHSIDCSNKMVKDIGRSNNNTIIDDCSLIDCLNHEGLVYCFRFMSCDELGYPITDSSGNNIYDQKSTYIGMTKNSLLQRMRYYLEAIRTGDTVDQLIMKKLRKHGNFIVCRVAVLEILPLSVSLRVDEELYREGIRVLATYEVEEIKKLDSFKNGLNQTRGGEHPELTKKETQKIVNDVYAQNP